ncbi:MULTISPECIES: hypothetical protein [Maricaulis]|uniref:Uncharacterized protein n=1 Tax=Maricaulis maris (strain MCS10) TaxID=394221 RepID=Q0ATC1_MARMM|nr:MULTISPECIES: hypothetical protein [Maricaulis]ABI64466.1 hypothetical protein Mmar10_0170 [Maricaulis maris MCS10]MAC89600.1 hypothetical protein [Maricaulis sp.]
MNSPVTRKVEEQLGLIIDDAARSWLSERLIEPRTTTLHWEYGKDEAFPAWIVGEVGTAGGRKIVIAYCEGGHGALGAPWGLIFADDEYFGMDCSWYEDLATLVRDERPSEVTGGAAL